MLVQHVNESNNLRKLTIKYFTAGHTFMSADNFHINVEKELNNDVVYDFEDFKRCIDRAGVSVELQLSGFKDFPNGVTKAKLSKETRPHLSDAVVVEFRKGSTKHDEEEFQECVFIKRKLLRLFQNNYCPSSRSSPRGVTAAKKRDIISKFGGLMGKNQLVFFQNLVESDVTDLIDAV